LIPYSLKVNFSGMTFKCNKKKYCLPRQSQDISLALRILWDLLFQAEVEA
jgi:hypothetical protein